MTCYNVLSLEDMFFYYFDLCVREAGGKGEGGEGGEGGQLGNGEGGKRRFFFLLQFPFSNSNLTLLSRTIIIVIIF